MSQDILERLYDVVQQRRRERPADSYVVSLLDGGVPAIAAKIREEAEELIEAASAEGASAHTANEAADLIFHTWVLLGSIDLSPADVYAVLEERFGTGGHVEKRARATAPTKGAPGAE